jgi:hypothetical protein
MPRTAKTKKIPLEKEVGGDGFKAILVVAVNETTSPNLPNKNQRREAVKSQVAGSKKEEFCSCNYHIRGASQPRGWRKKTPS